MSYMHEIPSDDDVVAILSELGGNADALTLCRALVAAGHAEGRSQLAIQRATDRGKLKLERDWTLSLVKEAVAA